MKYLVLGVFLFCGTIGKTQNLLRDNFSTFILNGDVNNQNGWTNNSSNPGGGGACAGAVCTNNKIATKAMSYINFGAATQAINFGPDKDAVGKSVTATTSGSLYVALLVNITTPTATAGDLFRLLAGGNFTTASRIQIRSTAGGFNVGIDKNGTAVSFAPSTYALNTDYLFVLKYTFNSGSASDDGVALYVNPDVSAPENTSTAVVNTTGGTDVSTLDRFQLPFNSSTRPTGFLGCISVSRDWGASMVMPASNITSINIFKNGYNTASLQWKVQGGQSIEQFAVQHSLNGFSFSTINTLPYTADGLYNSPLTLSEGNNYYRIMVTDKDKRTSYTQTLAVKAGKTTGSIITISPNPVKQHAQIKMDAEENGLAALQIADAQGKIVQQWNQLLQKGSNTFAVQLGSLVKGMYILRVTNSSGNTLTQQFIKD